jgi:catechol 2,3-dioxygenase-like lactoylglutathione lyase family enzyme
MQKIDQIYTVFITKRLKETVEFYERYFGCSKVFESTFFVLLQTPGEKRFSIAFMDEKHPTAPPSPQRFNGSGAFLTMEVSDAKRLFDEMKVRGYAITYELKDEEWGQRRFGILDPNELWIDIVEQIEPKEGYWEQYMLK